MAVLYENYDDDDTFRSFKGDDWYAQTFTPSISHTITLVQLKLKIQTGGDDPGTITVSIRDTTNSRPSGADLDSATIVGSTLTTSMAWYDFSGLSVALVADTQYAIVIRCDGSDYLRWAVDTAAPAYTDGDSHTSSDAGGSWGAGASADMSFKEWGGSINPPTTDAYTTKQLVTIGTNELWYESPAGTMIQLAASAIGGELDTTDFLTVVEAFEKVFIANGTNLKVADFGNTKIATTDLNTHAPDKGNILTGGTSGAIMIVDYITSVTADAACTIYGKRTTTATFSSGETVTGTDDDGNAITFATSAAETAPPHWYDWTVYGNDTTNFGDMPSSAYLVARYRGRLVLSGHPNYPHQWYMAKVSNPFNWIYGSTDPLTAVAGNNVDAGEIGDIVRAMIPYGDDFLVFGCADSVHIMDGDPAFGGSIDELSNITGIYGPLQR
jgi:hypothetical protein